MQNAPSEARESAAAQSRRAAWGTALALACLLSGRGSTVTAFTAKANNCFDNNDGLQEAIGQAGATCAYALQQNYCVTNAALAKKYCPATCGACDGGGTPPAATPSPTPSPASYECRGSNCNGESCPRAGGSDPNPLVCTGGSTCCGSDSMSPSCLAPNSGKQCCTHYMAAAQCDAADTCCGGGGPGASSSASCCKAPNRFCCGGWMMSSYGTCCKTNKCSPTGGCGGIGPTPTPPTPPPPPPPPSVMCNPSISPPQMCLGGKACPQCGRPQCPCPPPGAR